MSQASAGDLAFAVGVAFALVVLALVPRIRSLREPSAPPRPPWWAVALGIGMALVLRLLVDFVRR